MNVPVNMLNCSNLSLFNCSSLSVEKEDEHSIFHISNSHISETDCNSITNSPVTFKPDRLNSSSPYKEGVQ